MLPYLGSLNSTDQNCFERYPHFGGKAIGINTKEFININIFTFAIAVLVCLFTTLSVSLL